LKVHLKASIFFANLILVVSNGIVIFHRLLRGCSTLETLRSKERIIMSASGNYGCWIVVCIKHGGMSNSSGSTTAPPQILPHPLSARLQMTCHLTSTVNGSPRNPFKRRVTSMDAGSDSNDATGIKCGIRNADTVHHSLKNVPLMRFYLFVGVFSRAQRQGYCLSVVRECTRTAAR
jgi:hypothetical protein